MNQAPKREAEKTHEMNDHTHQFTELKTQAGTELLAPCRICRQPASQVLARVVLERDARLGQVYELLDAIAAILARPRGACSTRNTPRAGRTRRARGRS